MPQPQETRPDFAGDAAGESAFRSAVGALLDRLFDQIDTIESDDIDPSLTEGNLAVTFEDSGATFILSQQTPTRELWLSANLRAWHFTRTGGTWTERDTGRPLADVLGELFSAKVGQEIRFDF